MEDNFWATGIRYFEHLRCVAHFERLAANSTVLRRYSFVSKQEIREVIETCRFLMPPALRVKGLRRNRRCQIIQKAGIHNFLITNSWQMSLIAEKISLSKKARCLLRK